MRSGRYNAIYSKNYEGVAISPRRKKHSKKPKEVMVNAMPLRKQFFILGSLLYLTGRSAVCLSQMPGGYYPTMITKDVQQAAAFAVRQQSKDESAALKLIAIPKAEMQIVAGRNYRLVLKVKRGKKSGDAAVVVFEALPSRGKSTSTGVSTLSSSNYTLTSWQWISSRQPARKR